MVLRTTGLGRRASSLRASSWLPTARGPVPRAELRPPGSGLLRSSSAQRSGAGNRSVDPPRESRCPLRRRVNPARRGERGRKSASPYEWMPTTSSVPVCAESPVFLTLTTAGRGLALDRKDGEGIRRVGETRNRAIGGIAEGLRPGHGDIDGGTRANRSCREPIHGLRQTHAWPRPVQHQVQPARASVGNLGRDALEDVGVHDVAARGVREGGFQAEVGGSVWATWAMSGAVEGPMGCTAEGYITAPSPRPIRLRRAPSTPSSSAASRWRCQAPVRLLLASPISRTRTSTMVS